MHQHLNTILVKDSRRKRHQVLFIERLQGYESTLTGHGSMCVETWSLPWLSCMERHIYEAVLHVVDLAFEVTGFFSVVLKVGRGRQLIDESRM